MKAFKQLGKNVMLNGTVHVVLIDALQKRVKKNCEVVRLLDQMEEQGHKLSLATCRTLLHGFYKAEKNDKATRAKESMVGQGWVIDSISLTNLENEHLNNANFENPRSLLK